MDNDYLITKLKDDMAKENKHHLVYKIFTLNDLVDDLGLSSRSYNCIKRNKCNTIKELLENTDNLRKLNTLRNCGEKSVKEIRNKVFAYQLDSLSNDVDKEKYIEECVKLSY